MVWRAKWAGRDQRRAVAGEAGDAVDTSGLNRLGEGHRRQDGGESPCQHRLACPRGAEQEDIVVRTPACTSASAYVPGMPMPVPWPRSRSRSSGEDDNHVNASNNALASWRSTVSKPSVNQP